MPNDLSEVTQMATAGALVAAVAMPVGLVALALRPRGELLLPKWKPFPVPWNGFAVLIVFLSAYAVVPLVVSEVLENLGFFQLVYGAEFPLFGDRNLSPEQRDEAATLRGLWTSLLSLPLVLGGLFVAWRELYRGWRPRAQGSIASKVALAVVAWLLITPVVLALNAAVNWTAVELGVPPETHSLAKLGNRPALDLVLFVLSACVCAPLLEETVIRGAILFWCVGRMNLPGMGASPVTEARPWIVLVAGAVLCGVQQKWQPLAFAAVLALGLAALWRVKRTGARRTRAVYASAAFFALLHSVWPNPIALFVLGLALGYLAVRTNGLLVPVLVHALFNAVSVVFVLRGA